MNAIMLIKVLAILLLAGLTMLLAIWLIFGDDLF